MRNVVRCAPNLGALALVGCAASSSVPRPPIEDRPRIEALSTYAASLGQPISIYGSGFPSAAEFRAHFHGDYVTSGGTRTPVEVDEQVQRVDAGALVWPTFGPYRLPFAEATPELGTFEGTLQIERIDAQGSISVSDPLEMTFEVQPSILVRDFQPTTASCVEPVTRALGQVPYRMSIEALGFVPESVTYTLATPTLAGSTPIIEKHVVTSATDVLGMRSDWSLPAVPEGVNGYTAVLVIEARTSSGAVVRTNFALGVHRPIEVFYNGQVEIAEVYPAQPVSACTPGGVNGRSLTYNETNVETRSRSYSLDWNQSWLQSHTVSTGSSTTVGSSVSNGVGFGTQTGQSIAWNVGGEASGEVSIPGIVQIGVGGNASKTTTGSTSTTSNQTVMSEINSSSTTTVTDSIETSTGGSNGENFGWQVSSSDSIGRDFSGTVLASTYGVFYRQTMRLLRRAALVTYNQCGQAEVIGDVDFVDWTWAADLAIAESCPPLPASSLPPAECLIPPCEGTP
jgi:hypothetical protein